MAQQVTTAKRRTARKLSTSKCELLDTGRNKMYAERTAGRFTEMDDARPLLDGGPSDDGTDVHEGHSPTPGGQQKAATLLSFRTNVRLHQRGVKSRSL